MSRSGGNTTTEEYLKSLNTEVTEEVADLFEKLERETQREPTEFEKRILEIMKENIRRN